MRRVAARDANRRFSEILSAAETGEEVLITKRGRPVAVMVPYRPPAPAPERRAAIADAISVMDEPVAVETEFRASHGTKCASGDPHIRYAYRARLGSAALMREVRSLAASPVLRGCE